MNKLPPELIAIDPDDYAARRVGHAADGRQFFLTTPFLPAVNGGAGREFLALPLFDRTGKLLEARIEDLGPRANLDEVHARGRVEQLLATLGPVKRRRIWIAPFRVERFGTAFGLVAQAPEESRDEWLVTLEPGN